MTVQAEPYEDVLYLYVQHGCELCAEAEAELEASPFRFIKFHVTAAPEPAYALVWNPDGTTERVERGLFHGFPMLVDRWLGLRFVGLPAIQQRIGSSPKPWT